MKYETKKDYDVLITLIAVACALFCAGFLICLLLYGFLSRDFLDDLFYFGIFSMVLGSTVGWLLNNLWRKLLPILWIKDTLYRIMTFILSCMYALFYVVYNKFKSASKN
jgi:hypothetical protein